MMIYIIQTHNPNPNPSPNPKPNPNPNPNANLILTSNVLRKFPTPTRPAAHARMMYIDQPKRCKLVKYLYRIQ